MNPLKQLAGQTAVYGLGTIVPRLLNYLLMTPFYTRIFNQGEYGVVTELYAYVAFLLVLLTYGMETAYFRFSENEKDPKKVYSTSLTSLLITSSLFVILVILFNRPVAEMIRYSDHPEYIIYFAIIVSLDAFTAIPFARLRQQKKAFRFALLKIITVSTNIGLNFFFLWLCPMIYAKNPDSWILFFYDHNAGVAYAFIANLISSIITLFLLIPEIAGTKIRIERELFGRMMSYALPLLVLGLAGMVNEVADKIFLKYLWPDEKTALSQLGIYGANYRLAVLMTLFTQMFRYAAEPFFFSYAKDKNATKIYADVMKYFVIAGLFIFLGILLFLDIFKYFIGRDFHEGLFIVPIVLMANLLMGIFYNLSIWFKLKGKTMYGAYIALIGAFVTIVMNIFLIPIIGYLGCAWSHLVCYAVMIVITYLWGRRYLDVPYEVLKIMGYIALALALYFISRLVKTDVLALTLPVNIMFALLFMGVVFRLEKKELWSMMKRTGQ